jgi:hypothetical protein
LTYDGEDYSEIIHKGDFQLSLKYKKNTDKAENTLNKVKKDAAYAVFALNVRLLHLASKYSIC